jgi:hypothetical protein
MSSRQSPVAEALYRTMQPNRFVNGQSQSTHLQCDGKYTPVLERVNRSAAEGVGAGAAAGGDAGRALGPPVRHWAIRFFGNSLGLIVGLVRSPFVLARLHRLLLSNYRGG